jgi:hypothetical protein
MEFKVTDWLAMYAAVVSTLVFYWNIKQSKAKIKVNILPGFETIDGISTSGYFIIVRNVSSQVVPIGSIELLHQYERTSALGHLKHLVKYRRLSQSIGWVHHPLSHFKVDTKCPIQLEPRASHKVIVDFDTVENILGESSYRLIKASVQDQLWNNYFSKAIKATELTSKSA